MIGRLAGTAALLLTFGTAVAVVPPSMKEGLWLVHNRTINNPGDKRVDAVSTLCRSHAYDRYVRALAKRLTTNTNECTTLEDRIYRNTYSVATHCELGGVVIDSSSTTIYRSDSTHTETHQSYKPPLDGVSETTVIEDQKFLGPCPIGSKPGDMTRANGTELNLGPQQH